MLLTENWDKISVLLGMKKIIASETKAGYYFFCPRLQNDADDSRGFSSIPEAGSRVKEGLWFQGLRYLMGGINLSI